jgi:hypothetical protein
VQILNKTIATSFDSAGNPINIITTYDQAGVLINVKIEQATSSTEDFKKNFTAGSNTFDAAGNRVNTSGIVGPDVTTLTFTDESFTDASGAVVSFPTGSYVDTTGKTVYVNAAGEDVAPPILPNQISSN